MSSPFHEGERRVQNRAGVEAMANRVGTGIRAIIPPTAAEWLESQTLAAIASRAPDGEVWASIVVGAPGFLRASDENTLEMATQPDEGSPLFEALQTGEIALGLVILEPATRKRMRLNGVGALSETGLQVRASEVYSNCPKYIQTRVPKESLDISPEVKTGRELSDAQREWIEGADTFFIASLHPERGADCSHRGGSPGFVRVLGNGILEWDDFPGNAMFNTLGNLEVEPRSGLAFLDWENGAVLQLVGRTRTLWNGDGRVNQFEITGWRETRGALSFRWQFGEFSPFNPR